MIYNDHPGPWQAFLKRKDIIGLSPHDARKQYLIEQNGFNTGIAAAQAAAIAAQSSTSDGGLVREKRIAFEKGYSTTGYSKSEISNISYETFYYGTSPSQRVTANKGYPIWELQTGKKRGSRTTPSPSSFAYGYCIYDSDNYVWFLTNDPTVEDWQDSSVYAIGPGQGVQWGEYKVVGSDTIISIQPSNSSAFPIVYYDADDVVDNGGIVYKFFQTPIIHNNAPVYFDPYNEVIYVFDNFLDVDDEYGNGENVPQGLGWNMMELDDENLYTVISNIGTTDQPSSGYFSGSMPSSPDNPLGSANYSGDAALLFNDPNGLAITYETNLDVAQEFGSGWSGVGTYTPLADGSNNLILYGGRPQWQHDTTPSYYIIRWETNSWVLRDTDENVIVSYLSPAEISPDGPANGFESNGTPIRLTIEYSS